MRVCEARKQRAADSPLHGRLRRSQRALHLVEDHSLVAQSALWIVRLLELETNAFLLERVFGQPREESRVEIDVEEVHEVFRVARAEEVHRPVGACPGITEGGERAARHAEERVPYRGSMR